MFTLLGCRGSSWTRTQTWTLQGKILPCEARLLLQLALRHEHTYTSITTQTHAPDIGKGTLRWSKMSYCGNTDQIFMRWPTVSLNSNPKLGLHARSQIVIQEDKALINKHMGFCNHKPPIGPFATIYHGSLSLLFPWETLHAAELWMCKVDVKSYPAMHATLFYPRHRFKAENKCAWCWYYLKW